MDTLEICRSISCNCQELFHEVDVEKLSDKRWCRSCSFQKVYAKEYAIKSS